jgi:5-methylcytosine-specific restriction endonuclease McrA
MPSKVLKSSKHGLHFCCREHKDKAQRIGGLNQLQPEHYGTGSSRYRDRAFEAYPHICAICGYDEIPEILRVHHIDCDRQNNDISNLQILCGRCHDLVHWQIRKSATTNHKKRNN